MSWIVSPPACSRIPWRACCRVRTRTPRRSPALRRRVCGWHCQPRQLHDSLVRFAQFIRAYFERAGIRHLRLGALQRDLEQDERHLMRRSLERLGDALQLSDGETVDSVFVAVKLDLRRLAHDTSGNTISNTLPAAFAKKSKSNSGIMKSSSLNAIACLAPMHWNIRMA